MALPCTRVPTMKAAEGLLGLGMTPKLPGA
jgi:hypothetical protein